MSQITLTNDNVQIVRGYTPDLVKAAVDMQVKYYTRTPGFNEEYESGLAQGLAKLSADLADQHRSEVWAARVQDQVIGAIFVDGKGVDGKNHARLTSFIVGDGFRGKGIGRRLLTEAIKFVDERGFEETFLWTFAGSDAARRLYESVDFVLEKQVEGLYQGERVDAMINFN